VIGEIAFALRFLFRRGQYSDDEAVVLFKANPFRWFFGSASHPFEWPHNTSNGSINPDKIYIYVGSQTIGYIQGLHIQLWRKTAYVRHFAVASGLERRGIGTAMAYALRLALTTHYGVKSIIFDENSSGYATKGYESFFQSLGATPCNPVNGGHHDWKWGA